MENETPEVDTNVLFAQAVLELAETGRLGEDTQQNLTDVVTKATEEQTKLVPEDYEDDLDVSTDDSVSTTDDSVTTTDDSAGAPYVKFTDLGEK